MKISKKFSKLESLVTRSVLNRAIVDYVSDAEESLHSKSSSEEEDDSDFEEVE